MNMAPTAYNGDNETNIGFSKSLSYTIYDENQNEIPVKNQTKPIELWIPKELNNEIESYKYINATQLSSNTSATNSSYSFINGYLSKGFRLSGNNVSVHIQLKPDNKNVLSYLILLKFGDNPSASSRYFDEWRIFCPSGK